MNLTVLLIYLIINAYFQVKYYHFWLNVKLPRRKSAQKKEKKKQIISLNLFNLFLNAAMSLGILINYSGNKLLQLLMA